MRAFIQNLRAMLSDQAPVREATTAVAGAQGLASRGDHQHPRLTSASWGTTNASGEVTFAFTRSFATKPSIDFTYEENADAQPVVFKVKAWQTDGSGNYTGATAKGYRFQTLPSSLTLITQLLNFSVTINAPSGLQVSCIALQQS